MPGLPFVGWRLVRQAEVVNLHLPQLEGAFLAVIARLLCKRLVVTYQCDVLLPSGMVNRLANAAVALANHITASLAQIQAPTLVMVGEQDILKGRRFADLIAGCIRGAELAVVPGAGHALCIEKPDIFNSLVLGFIRKHAQPG